MVGYFGGALALDIRQDVAQDLGNGRVGRHLKRQLERCAFVWDILGILRSGDPGLQDQREVPLLAVARQVLGDPRSGGPGVAKRAVTDAQHVPREFIQQLSLEPMGIVDRDHVPNEQHQRSRGRPAGTELVGHTLRKRLRDAAVIDLEHVDVVHGSLLGVKRSRSAGGTLKYIISNHRYFVNDWLVSEKGRPPPYLARVIPYLLVGCLTGQ